ncbi:hypothetical protein DBV15_07362 [Temnothorax longispinosus]|uniref:Uncharacterized protein n=1 Tax=Temnothorax longispinosus TaxID=300112 RepID=A0A4S2KFL9_9HYME|nr:hypothetical protein DBV15_07362 [Temnothorax longispinosus]
MDELACEAPVASGGVGQRYRRSINHRAGGDVELFLEVVAAPHWSARLFMQVASAHYFASHLSVTVVCRKFESRYLLLDLRSASALSSSSSSSAANQNYPLSCNRSIALALLIYEIATEGPLSIQLQSNQFDNSQQRSCHMYYTERRVSPVATNMNGSANTSMDHRTCSFGRHLGHYLLDWPRFD